MMALRRLSHYKCPEYPGITIGEAGFPVPFKTGLEYSAPARGMWTIAHSPMLIPDSHEIFVCPSCCLRGVVLSAEEMDAMDRFSMVTLDEDAILKGSIDAHMTDGIMDILDSLEKKPPCVLVFTSCVHHFLHCDLKNVFGTLERKYPDIDFIDCYMIPTMRKGRFTPDTLMRRQLYRPLVRCDREDNRINIIGNYFALSPSSEILTLLEDAGYIVSDICHCKEYHQYKDMARASYNLCLLPHALAAVMDLKERLGQTPIYMPVSFDFKKIRENYAKLFSSLGCRMPSDQYFSRMETDCCRRLETLSKKLEGTKVFIDYTATTDVLGLARLLLDYGINVEAVYADSFDLTQKDSFEYLKDNHPNLMLCPTIDYSMRISPRDTAQKLRESGYGCLAIGQKAAYFTGSSHMVNLIENAGLYGYDGIMRLADMMDDALTQESDVRGIIQKKAWGCCG